MKPNEMQTLLLAVCALDFGQLVVVAIADASVGESEAIPHHEGDEREEEEVRRHSHHSRQHWPVEQHIPKHK